jgi:hypothetical protein
MSSIANFKKESLPSASLDLEEFREIALLGFLKVVARICRIRERGEI